MRQFTRLLPENVQRDDYCHPEESTLDLRNPMTRAVVLMLAALASLSAARAAQLEGVPLPDTRIVHGTRLLLNGIGLRTYSIFRIHVYVAGLYLQQRNADPETILDSNGMKLLDMRFVHDVTPEQARTAWRDGFEQNCRPPCHLDRTEMLEFLDAIPPIHSGDETTLLFNAQGVDISINHRLIGQIDDPAFAHLMLATFIGDVPPTAQLKRQLLGMGSWPVRTEAAK